MILLWFPPCALLVDYDDHTYCVSHSTHVAEHRSNIFLSFGELDVNLHLWLSACLFLNLRHLILEFRSGLYEILNGHLGWKLLQRVMVLISCADKNATNQSNIFLSFGEVDRDRCSQHL
jgi:hypothetical protein